ncbi:hypothetical protein ACFYY8_31470 [Streptosporangium sp. NPDC001559]|uniref:hypothetical protein n=1 Tax=Streptosporangium sp. NPDC001559 TaxID=3366187 RepID=UPI0036EDC8B2
MTTTVRVLITVGDTAQVVTPLHPAKAPLHVSASLIASQARLPVSELPGRQFTVDYLTEDSADGFTLLNDPRL